jgi:hypothetical protein
MRSAVEGISAVQRNPIDRFKSGSGFLFELPELASFLVGQTFLLLLRQGTEARRCAHAQPPHLVPTNPVNVAGQAREFLECDFAGLR